MKKWYWIIGLGLAALAYIYFIKKNKSTEIETWQSKERGEAETINDLPVECQQKFAAWSKWMESIKGSANAWPASIQKRADVNGTSFEIELAKEFVNMYNLNKPSAQCND